MYEWDSSLLSNEPPGGQIVMKTLPPTQEHSSALQQHVIQTWI